MTRRQPSPGDRAPALPGLAPPGGADDAVITAVLPARKPGRWAVKVGRARVAVVDQHTVDELGLQPGLAWTPALADRLRAAERHIAARDAGIRLLKARSRSRADLVRRLIARGFERATAEAAAADLEASGVLNDQDAARSLVRAATAHKPVARTALLHRLAGWGIERRTAETAIAAERGDVDDQAAANHLALARAKAIDPRLPPEVVRRRVLGTLARRGFDEETSLHAVDRVLKRLARRESPGE